MYRVSVYDFAQEYIDKGYPHNVDLMNKVFYTDVSASTLVYKEDAFLAELYFMAPNKTITPHRHPFDSVTVVVGGELTSLNGETYTTKFHTPGIVTKRFRQHSFSTGPKGCVMYVLSYWYNKEEMDSATIRYIGKPLGEIHNISLNNSNRGEGIL